MKPKLKSGDVVVWFFQHDFDDVLEWDIGIISEIYYPTKEDEEALVVYNKRREDVRWISVFRLTKIGRLDD